MDIPSAGGFRLSGMIIVKVKLFSIHHKCICSYQHTLSTQGNFFAILGRGPRAFQVREISAVNR